MRTEHRRSDKSKGAGGQGTNVPQERVNDAQNLWNKQLYFSIQDFSSILITFHGMKYC
jgi:hypothetical protein